MIDTINQAVANYKDYLKYGESAAGADQSYQNVDLTATFDGLWALTKRTVSEAQATGIPGIGGTVFKLSYSEAGQQLAQLSMELLGESGLLLDPLQHTVDGQNLDNGELVEAWIKSFNLTIAAGTSQIQRNIVSERILGLPKEPAGATS